VNVGECTRAVMPSPRAMPFTSCVLPAPKSPDRPMTSPRCAARPQRSPSDPVSAGLCEMNVAMGCKRLGAGLVANGDAFVRRDFADATQFQFRKLFFPRIEQFHRVGARHREQQFKILAIGQRRSKWCFWWGERPREP